MSLPDPALDTTPEGIPVPRFVPWRPERWQAGGWTAETQRAFIHELTRIGSVGAAARAVGKTARGAYLLRNKPGAESFAAAWCAALAEGRGHAAQTAIEHALYGKIAPVFRRGRFAGYRVVNNDRLLIAALRSGRHDDYDEAEELATHRDRIERWEAVLRREAFERIEHTRERRAEAERAAAENRALERAVAYEKKRQLNAEMRALARTAMAPKPRAAPWIRSL